MSIQTEIKTYIASQPEPKRADLKALHALILKATPKNKLRANEPGKQLRANESGKQLWFLDGKNEQGKVVSNPNIGYGLQTIEYAGGKTREFYRVGLSANSSGISVYILGLADKKYLQKTYGKKLGKASVTGYCIKFKALEDIDVGTLTAAIKDGFAA